MQELISKTTSNIKNMIPKEYTFNKSDLQSITRCATLHTFINILVKNKSLSLLIITAAWPFALKTSVEPNHQLDQIKIGLSMGTFVLLNLVTMPFVLPGLKASLLIKAFFEGAALAVTEKYISPLIMKTINAAYGENVLTEGLISYVLFATTFRKTYLSLPGIVMPVFRACVLYSYTSFLLDKMNCKSKQIN